MAAPGQRSVLADAAGAPAAARKARWNRSGRARVIAAGIAAGVALSNVLASVVDAPSVSHAAERVATPVQVKACTIDDAAVARKPGWLTVNAAGGVEDGFAAVEGCFYALTLVSAAGSAHGAGWYTNVLQVEDTHDTVLPLTVLVKRDKHASSPDRDGNGKYMPHYDTNKYSNDAWGIRDVVATGRLGGASFRAESQDDRTNEGRLFPRAMPRSFIKLYEARRRSWDAEAKGAVLRTEALGEHLLCTTPPTGRLLELRNGKNFCGRGDRQTRLTRPHSLTTSLKQVTDRVSPGPGGRYGFMSYAQRLSVSARLDSGVGISTILPLGAELPLFGGWLVPKATLVWNNPKLEQTQSYAVDLLYAPSGSRLYDWYLAGGLERWRESEHGGLHWGPAGEAGVKFRYNAEKLRKRIGFQFVGARIAVRTSSFTRPADMAGMVSTARRTRLVFEVGAGAW